ncbi:MAG: hypothetical protein RR253_04300, partial [Oscillospiraceae bacterium]
MKIRTKLCAVVCTVIMIFTLAAMPTFASNNQTPTAAKKISVSFKDADLRDALSAIAMNMGYSVIFAGASSRVTFELKSTTPAEAFDYVVKLAGLDYIKDGNSFIVGSKDSLMDDFAKTLSMTSFNLSYIYADVLKEKIDQLGFEVQVILMPANNKAIWVRGLASEIGKVNELIKILDIYDNSESGSIETGKQLQTITLNVITAAQFNEFIKGLGFESGVSPGNNGKTLWVYATLDEYHELWRMKELVDVAGGDLSASSTKTTSVITIVNMSKDEAIAAIASAYPEVKTYSLDNAAMSFVIVGKKGDVEGAYSLISQLDVTNTLGIEKTVFRHQLLHISAQEAERRLKNITFTQPVTWYINVDGGLSTTIFMYCPSDYAPKVQAVLAAIDIAPTPEGANKVGFPVYKTSTVEEAQNVQAYIVTMLGGLITGDFNVYNLNGKFVLYLSNTTPETVAL